VAFGFGVTLHPLGVQTASLHASLTQLWLPETQLPPWQVSAPLHGSWSSQPVPSATGVYMHVPPEQAPVWQPFGGEQVTGVPRTQLWLEVSQVSIPLQSSPSEQSPLPLHGTQVPAPSHTLPLPPSLHGVPAGDGVNEHCIDWHAPTRQAFGGWHCPASVQFTQLPIPSHTVPPPVPHGVLFASFVTLGLPSVHVSVLQI
jgi:hypothetical protein